MGLVHCSIQELEEKIELSLRKSDVNSKSARSKRKQQRKRSSSEVLEETSAVSKKRKTEVSVVEEDESEDESIEEEVTYSSSESPVSSEEEDDEICIQPQRPRLAAAVGFNWDTSDNINTNVASSSDENEPMETENEVITQFFLFPP